MRSERQTGAVNAQRTSYVVKAIVLLIFVLLDVVFLATVDIGTLPEEPSFLRFVYLAIPLVLQVGNALIVFLMLSGTYLFQVGLLGMLLSEFTLVLVTIPTYFIAFLAYAGVKISMLTRRVPSSEFFQDPLFLAFAYILRVVNIVYLFVMINVAFRLGQRRWYAKAPWVKKFREQYPVGGFGVTDID